MECDASESYIAARAGLVVVLGFEPAVAAAESIPQVGQQAPDLRRRQKTVALSLSEAFAVSGSCFYFYLKDQHNRSPQLST